MEFLLNLQEAFSIHRKNEIVDTKLNNFDYQYRKRRKIINILRNFGESRIPFVTEFFCCT